MLLAGDVLAITGSSDLTVSVGDIGVVVRGAAQVSRGHSIVVSTYTGSADVTVAGQTLTVPALRQAIVPASGPVPPAPTPVVYDAGDTWDLRYLGDAIALGNELDARSQGFSAQVGPTDGRTADFFRRLLDPLAQQPSFTDGSLAGDRPPGETLVGAAIAVEGTMGTFDERWTEVFAFRDQGASWGLVALDQGVTRSPLVALVDGGIGRGPSLIAPASVGRRQRVGHRPAAAAERRLGVVVRQRERQRWWRPVGHQSPSRLADDDGPAGRRLAAPTEGPAQHGDRADRRSRQRPRRHPQRPAAGPRRRLNGALGESPIFGLRGRRLIASGRPGRRLVGSRTNGGEHGTRER